MHEVSLPDFFIDSVECVGEAVHRCRGKPTFGKPRHRRKRNDFVNVADFGSGNTAPETIDHDVDGTNADCCCPLLHIANDASAHGEGEHAFVYLEGVIHSGLPLLDQDVLGAKDGLGTIRDNDHAVRDQLRHSGRGGVRTVDHWPCVGEHAGCGYHTLGIGTMQVDVRWRADVENSVDGILDLPKQTQCLAVNFIGIHMDFKVR